MRFRSNKIVKIIFFNINHGKIDEIEIKNFFIKHAEDADVFCLQEAADVSKELLDDILADFDISDDMEKNRKRFKRSLISLSTILKLLQHAIGLINPFLDHIQNKLEEKELDYDFLSYLFQETALNLHHFLISEEYKDDLFNIYNEFRSKIEELEEKSKKEKERSLIFVDSLLPLRDMLKYRTKK